MKLSGSIFSILMVVTLTIASAAYRVSTAPERKRMRLDTARATCVNSGGEWVRNEDQEETCRTVTARK